MTDIDNKKIENIIVDNYNILIDRKNNLFQKYVGLVPTEMLEIDIKKVFEK